MKLAILLSGLVLSLVSQSSLSGEVFYGRVVSVLDGDTIDLLDQNHNSIRIRFAEIDAPEVSHGKTKPGQPYGGRSQQSLASMVAGKKVEAQCPGRESYGRPVCQVKVDGIDANLEQIRQGMAMIDPRYARTPAYLQAQGIAQENRQGLWQQDEPVPPWIWRKHSWH